MSRKSQQASSGNLVSLEDKAQLPALYQVPGNQGIEPRDLIGPFQLFLMILIYVRQGKSTLRCCDQGLKIMPLSSVGNAALLLILSAQHSFLNHNKMYLCFILGILSVELICTLICLVVYTVKVSNFNRAKPRPDVIEEEKIYAYPNHVTSEIGFRDTSSLEEIVEKQGDVIEYLRRHNAQLSKKLLAVTSQQGRG
ncbi:hypothetical protein EYD10_09642 [Varanus komodoensis]|nr:hypothetical protein EYD10_09642 [Varanus komodoensis]